VPHLGVKATTENGRELIKFVEAGTPAYACGIDAGDELLAIDGIRVTAQQLSDRLKDYQPATLSLSRFSIKTNSAPIPLPRRTTSQPLPGDTLEHPSPTQKQNFVGG